MKKSISLILLLSTVFLLSTLALFSQEEKIYKEIQIGEQIWMMENLNITHFHNGDPIPVIKKKKKWHQASEEQTPAMCYYENDESFGEIEGALYNYHVLEDERGFAPEGWRIPAEEDWNILKEHLDGWKNAGRQLKSKEGWDSFEGKNGNGNNLSGYNVKPSNRRWKNGEFKDYKGLGTGWWIIEEQNQWSAWTIILSHKDDQVLQFPIAKGSGFAVRCIKASK